MGYGFKGAGRDCVRLHGMKWSELVAVSLFSRFNGFFGARAVASADLPMPC